MSSQYTFQSSSYKSSSSTVDGRTTSYTESSHSDPSGTTIHRTSQQPGQKPTNETVHLPASGSEGVQDGGTRQRIEDVTDKDREYEENMEDEYAKREGGA
ncbi:hypothetical protein AOQ84DRAFT_91561 [Glonium stellatum]|uniref:Uncharacterized protein n=1 Tax=Glonium stellatum TaxID=574774 RepID=A0A8E2JQC6_9PEZI|nr:hypothetical protein AOQ84DRAFT_91561 [Glonium stellatum]